MVVFELQHIFVNLFDDFVVDDEDLNLLSEYMLMLNDNQESFVQMDHVTQSMVEVQVSMEVESVMMVEEVVVVFQREELELE